MNDKITILKLQPHFEYRVWANKNIKEIFKLKEDLIGEAWLIACFPNKSSLITNLDKKQTLFEFYNDLDNGYFFDGYNIDNEYPLLAKIIDAKADLSVQIHPDDIYAKKENSLGKTECWFILDTKDNNSVVLGHKAKTLDEFKQKVINNDWNSLLIEKPIKKNDFIYVPTKKIHAIKADSFIYELQQSSDITYRVYDYDRLDKGKLRELHLDDVYNLVQCPDYDLKPNEISDKKDYLVSNKQFKLLLIENDANKEYFFEKAKWIQLTVIEGEKIKINGLIANKIDSFLIAHNTKIEINGKCKCLISYID